jgi:hypothetical protein
MKTCCKFAMKAAYGMKVSSAAAYSFRGYSFWREGL